MENRQKVTKQTRKHYRTIARDLFYPESVATAIMDCTYEDEINRILINARKGMYPHGKN